MARTARSANKPNSQKIVEEYDENEATGVEAEEAGTAIGPASRPYDPAKIRIDSKTFSLRQIIEMVNDGDLDLAPDFQRKKVWKAREKSRLIESILLRIPLPAFYFSADRDGRLRVVDGLQRLSTVHDFAGNRKNEDAAFALCDLEYLTNLAGKRYADLDQAEARRFQQTQIMVNVIETQTPPQVKFDIFKRLNTGGTPLNAQEMRHCMSRPRSREFIKACAGGFIQADERAMPFSEYKAAGGKLPDKVYRQANNAALAFGEALNWAMWNHVRMADREIVLRFCAFRLVGKDLGEYSESESMDDFLTEATERIDLELSDKILLALAADLERAMVNARGVFGSHAFRKWRTGDDSLNPINRALFESWATALADFSWSDLEPHQSAIVTLARKQMTKGREYIEAISTGTGDHAKVRLRFDVARKVIEEALS